jgi:hypothetical protein
LNLYKLNPAGTIGIEKNPSRTAKSAQTKQALEGVPFRKCTGAGGPVDPAIENADL